MAYITKCPKCGGQLMLHTATVFVEGVEVEPDGFCISDARRMDTIDESVKCKECGGVYPLRDDSNGPYPATDQDMGDYESHAEFLIESYLDSLLDGPIEGLDFPEEQP